MKIKMLLILIQCLCFLNIFVKCNMNKNSFNVNDILRKDLMPTYFIIGDENQDNVQNETGKITSSSINGSIDAALSTMVFHRKMMNEYQCRNFVAEQILEELDRPMLQSRVGKPFTKKQQPQENFYQFIRNNFLNDIGSSNYQDWLNKHETAPTHANETFRIAPPKGFQSRDGYAVYDTGDTSGVTEQHHTVPAVSAYDLSKYSGGFEYTAPPAPPLYQHPAAHLQDEHYTKYEVEPEHHGFGLSELFEIALTGIAYLSFGMFVLHVLMCVSMNKHPHVMQMVDASGDKISIDDTIRFKRWTTDDPGSPSLNTLNNLARHALAAFRPMKPGCLQRTLCLSNSQARNLNDGAQYWLPFWNVGVSWRAGAGAGASVGGALRAAALGLGGAPCARLYPPSLCHD